MILGCLKNSKIKYMINNNENRSNWFLRSVYEPLDEENNISSFCIYANNNFPTRYHASSLLVGL